MKNERELQRRCLVAARKADWLAYKFDSPGQRGVPDVLLISFTGRVVLVEFKHPNGRGRLSELQKIVLEEVRARGIEVYIIDSFEDFLNVIA